jgi:polysaccharide biosynthesis/export protein
MLTMATTKAAVISMRTVRAEMHKQSFRKHLPALVLALFALGLVTLAPFALGQRRVTDPAPALRISAGDLLAVDVFDTPELSAKLRVSEKGDIDLPVAGTAHVGGLTAEEAASTIERLLGDDNILKHPHVEVFIQEYATQGVAVLGEVKNPGVYPQLGSHSLLDFIAVAGGITPTAGKAVTITRKNDPDNPVIVQLESNGPDVAKQAGMSILPGDTIIVSRSGIVYVIGDLGKPGGFLIDTNQHLTALQAVALAQGANKDSALNGSRLIRKTPNGPPLESRVELGKILAGKQRDISLEDGDILFVPTSKSKTIAFQGISSTISLISGIAIYRGF